jgi:hypothetical protein
LSGGIPDPTNGATFFYSGEKPPPTFFQPRIASGRLAPVDIPGVTMHYLRDMGN